MHDGELTKRNAAGQRIGQSHPRAKLSDLEVEYIRRLATAGLTHREIAAKFEISKSMVTLIVNYHRR